jgi:hypothetical protein
MSWKIDAGRNLELRPEVFGKLDATSTALGARAFSGGLRVNFLLDPENRTTRRDLPSFVDDDERELSPLDAAVRITSNGVSLDEVKAEPRTVLYRSFETVLPFIEIPTVADRSRVERIIATVGKRLGEAPTTLTLAPTNSDEILRLAGRQLLDSLEANALRSSANGVKAFTADLRSPIRLTSVTASGLVINAEPALLRPIADQWVESRFQLPPITIERYTDTRVGIKSWSVAVRQGRRTLARYSNTQGSTAELESGLFINQDGNGTITPIVAEMTITDLEDQTMTVFDTLRLLRGAADPNRADSTVYEYTFYSVASNNSAFEVLSTSRKLLLKTLRDQLRDTKNIEIQYGNGSMSLATDLLGEISRLTSDTSSDAEIRLRANSALIAPTSCQIVRVVQAN